MSKLSDRYLFRGKRMSDDWWVEGSLVIQSRGVCFIFDLCDGLLYIVDPKTVGQYTGEIDKNGAKIFDGDIINVEFEQGGPPWEQTTYWEKGTVYWDKDRHCWYVRFKNDIYVGDELMPLWNYDPFDIEVTGNIYDNPDLRSWEQSGDSGGMG